MAIVVWHCCQMFTNYYTLQLLHFPIWHCVIFHMHQQDIQWAPDDDLSVSSPPQAFIFHIWLLYYEVF